MSGPAGPVTRAGQVIEALFEAGQTLAVAESLTGGLVVAGLVDVPGASAVLRGGVVAYATDLKQRLLGVDAELLARRGAVDAEVAGQMAAGAAARLGASWGLATTGVAGPDAQDGHPPGTVFVAVTGPAGARVRSLHLDGDRAAVREATVAAAFDLLLFALGEHEA